MAQGVVMIQSDIKGGSLHASRASLDYGRWLAVPYPTDKDRENREPKIQANMLLAEGPAPERADLLRSNISALRQVIILRSREDYLRMLKTSEYADQSEVLVTEMPGRRFVPAATSAIAEPEYSPSPMADLFGAEQAVRPTVVPEATENAPVNDQPDVTPSQEHSPTPFESPHKYRVVIRQKLPADARVFQFPPLESIEPYRFKSPILNSNTLAFFSARLRYIQDRIDTIKSLQDSLPDMTRAEDSNQTLRLTTEDLVTQIGRVADLFSRIDKAHPHRTPQQTGSGDERDSWAKGMSVSGRLRDAGDVLIVAEVLGDLRDSYSHWSGVVTDDDKTTEVDLSDIIAGLNRLLVSGLDSDK